MEKLYFAVVVLLVSAITATSMAHDGATGVVKDRMEAMDKLGQAVKTIAEMIRGKTAYEASVVKVNANLIKHHSGSSLTDLFPKDSLEKPSQAREKIWSNWDEFKELASRMEILATGLEAAADNGISGATSMNMKDMLMMMNDALDMNALAKMPVDGVFLMIAKTCGACHEKFREISE